MNMDADPPPLWLLTLGRFHTQIWFHDPEHAWLVSIVYFSNHGIGMNNEQQLTAYLVGLIAVSFFLSLSLSMKRLWNQDSHDEKTFPLRLNHEACL